MITLGADPEFFMARDGVPLASCGLLGGKKGRPIPLGNGEGFGLQEDNVMVEWNIPPCRTIGGFAKAINSGIDLAFDHVAKQVPGAYVLEEQCSVIMPPEQLTHRRAMQFGCAPDFCAYSGGAPAERIDPEDLITEDGGQWRFAGGHVHLGYDNPAGIPPHVVAAFCDVYLGLWEVSDLRVHSQGERRKYYGQAGRFRPTAYGIEYRTLGNAWTFGHAPAVASRTHALLSNIEAGNADRLRQWYKEIPWADVREIISNEDAPSAESLIDYVYDLGVMDGEADIYYNGSYV